MSESLSLATVRLSNSRPLEQFDFIRINPDRSVTWYNSRPRKQHENSQKNLDEKRGQYNGFMSDATTSKVKKMLSLWMAAMQVGIDHAKKTYGDGKKCPYYPRFLTLTLPSKQKEGDQEFKRKYLERFIQELKRRCLVKYYFWKAEPQGNGNIHFHFIIDRWVDKVKIQKIWCHILEPYVLEYQKKHGDCTRLPPCVKIERVRNQKKLGDYAVKYALKEGDEDRRAIEGRIWGASKELKELKGLEVYHGEVARHQLEFEMDQVKHYKVDYAGQDEYYCHVKFSNVAWKQMNLTRMHLTKHIEKIYKALYNGRTLDYEKMVKKKILNSNYLFNRYLYAFDPVNNVAAPCTIV